jgi:hypothetical protein
VLFVLPFVYILCRIDGLTACQIDDPQGDKGYGWS